MKKESTPYLKDVGRKVKELRTLKGLYVRDLGKLCNTDYANLSRFENGQVNIKLMTLKSIADVLGVDIKYFL